MEHSVDIYNKNYKYIVYKFSNPEDAEKLRMVREKAESDARKMNRKDPSGEERPDDVILWRNMGGVLAEKVVRKHLKDLIAEKKVNAEVLPEEKFTSHAEHRDVKVKVNGKIKTIEVRSSFNYLTTLERVLTGAFSLLASYTTGVKSEEPDKDFFITVIHRYNYEEIEEKFRTNVETYIIGGGSKATFKELGEIDPKMKQRGANYLTIRPIISAPDTEYLFNEILEIPYEKPKELKQKGVFDYF